VRRNYFVVVVKQFQRQISQYAAVDSSERRLSSNSDVYASAVVHAPSIPLPDIPVIDVDRLSSDELTVVTAFFDIGSFEKGAGGPTMSSAVYQRWMSIFARISNPVVAYFDQLSNADLMRLYRRGLPANRTRVVLIDRPRTVSFGRFRPRIDDVFRRLGYPRRSPNTSNANYSAAMHAKYEIVLRTINDDPFNTRYYCWLDVGLFRELLPRRAGADNFLLRVVDDDESGDGGGGGGGGKGRFRLGLPVGFDDSRIAYTEISEPDASVERRPTAEEIVRHEYVWVCGCFFLGRADRLARWAVEYLLAVDKMLEAGWMSSDQQVIYWVFHGTGRKVTRTVTRIQTYKRQPGDVARYNDWFHLGYLAKEAGENRTVVETKGKSVGNPKARS
jgi:hypothetical protein